jgi:hypothetical protein
MCSILPKIRERVTNSLFGNSWLIKHGICCFHYFLKSEKEFLTNWLFEMASFQKWNLMCSILFKFRERVWQTDFLKWRVHRTRNLTFSILLKIRERVFWQTNFLKQWVCRMGKFKRNFKVPICQFGGLLFPFILV